MFRECGKIGLGLALAAAFSACGGQKQEEQPGGTTEAPADETVTPASTEATAGRPGVERPAVFGRCMSCHSAEPGVNRVGPSLSGVFGRKAGIVPGFKYSDAVKNSGLTWDEATLDKWLSGPRKLLPGTKMTFPGIPSPALRRELIAYLRSVK